MDTKDVIFIVLCAVLIVWEIYKECKRHKNGYYCTCKANDYYLFIHGYCVECGKPDGDWYP